MFANVAVIGLGLIGASLVRDLRTHKLAERVVGVDSDPASGAFLEKQGLLDAFYASPGEADERCDFVILATPPDAFAQIAATLAPLLADGAIVMDAGSVKRQAIAAIAPRLPARAAFVPAHPIAGGERSGPGAARSGLFLHRRVILTPDEATPPPALERAARFWEAVGAAPEIMSAAQHDAIYAVMSHLPQVAAYALCLALAETGGTLTEETRAALRIGGSSPGLWSAIALANHDELLPALRKYIGILEVMAGELAAPEPASAAEAREQAALAGLLLRLAASSLIGVVTVREKELDLKIARYAGQGFIDMTLPLRAPPEADIERISGLHGALLPLLQAFLARLRDVETALAAAASDAAALAALFAEARRAWERLYMPE